MADIGEAAAIIGVTDFALKSISSLYDFVQNMREVAEQLENFHGEISSLQDRLSSLSFLEQADPETLCDVEATGVGPAINHCGEACDKFQKELDSWIKHGSGDFRDRLRVVLHQRTISRLTTTLWTTHQRLQTAVGILTLKIVWKNRSLADKATEKNRICGALATSIAVAKAKVKDITRAQAQLDEDEEENPDTDEIREEMQEEGAILFDFQKSCRQMSETIQKLQLTQTIEDSYSGKEANVMIGMPADVVEKVAVQNIKRSFTGEKATVRIGIWDEKAGKA